ncbi:CPBP family intramembrane glutamic endopeptidase [Psychroserpens sp. NJDZ02]|uniref:CPBP family intramembrane glutamic endopeptidase n=1 Tax=Psychroserpens sp. NJDZ02 TaxID=2570561 RepID=UPI0010A902A7|nr:CPBP family intramembrane glutamic endopeptidase [Psychroserpens sp. NJDZ02]QCE42302.1 CPBP family intramembrane metalloprotease [Psychroserpens sp. NJDZ02]
MNNELISILKAILATLLYLTGIELIGSWFYIVEAIEFENYYKYYFLIQGFLQLLGVLIFIYFIKNQNFKYLIKKTNRKWYLFAVILGISFVLMQTPLKWIYNILFETEYYIAYRFDGLPKFKNINLIASILLIPIGEELFFREYIQNNLQKKTNTIVSILLASVLFASIHSPYMNLILESSKQDWHLFYLTIFGGIISGILYFKSKSIGPSIIFHMFWNLMVIIV